jgi:sirohydrochlorin cobaltochelatase
MKTAVIILGHGSRSGGADETVKRVAAKIQKSGGSEQYVQPTPREALEHCIRQRAKKIVIVPFFMQPGAHVRRDIPAFVEMAKKEHPDIDIMATDFVGSHPLMGKIVEDLVEKTK